MEFKGFQINKVGQPTRDFGNVSTYYKTNFPAKLQILSEGFYEIDGKEFQVTDLQFVFPEQQERSIIEQLWWDNLAK